MPLPGRPHALILAGPNGAGKSTLAPWLLAGELGVRTFVNADVIAQGLAGFDPASAAIEAGRIMLRRLDELRRAGADFAFETTLSGLAHRRTLHRLHESGYETHLVYLWLPSPDTAVERVRTRVRLGGHDVPERDVRRRYWRSVANFELYRRSVRWWVYHAAGAIGAQPSIIAEGDCEVIERMHDENAWAALQSAAVSGPHGGEERGH